MDRHRAPGDRGRQSVLRRAIRMDIHGCDAARRILRYAVAKLHGLDAAASADPPTLEMARSGQRPGPPMSRSPTPRSRANRSSRRTRASDRPTLGSGAGRRFVSIRRVCLRVWQPASGSAPRSSTHPAHGTSVTCMPPTRRRPRRSTRGIRMVRRQSRVRDDDPPARLRRSSRGHRRSGDTHPSGWRHGTAWASPTPSAGSLQLVKTSSRTGMSPYRRRRPMRRPRPPPRLARCSAAPTRTGPATRSSATRRAASSRRASSPRQTPEPRCLAAPVENEAPKQLAYVQIGGAHAGRAMRQNG